MTVRFDYSAPESVAAFMEGPELRYVFKYWWPVGIAAMAVMFLRHPAKSLPDFLTMFALMSPVTATFLLMPYFGKRLALSRARRSAKERSDLSEIRSFGAEGFVSAPAWTEPVPWSFITKVVELDRFFFVYHSGSQQSEYVPKSAMTETEVRELRALFRKYLDSQSAQLKLCASAPQAAG